MPLKGGRYRVVRRGGQKVRLHFTDAGRVNEAKNLGTGATHTSAEFAADRRAPKRALDRLMEGR